MAGTFWFSEALGSAEPVAFQKRPGIFYKIIPEKKKKSLEIWENVVRNAKNPPWNATRQLFSGLGGVYKNWPPKFRNVFAEKKGATEDRFRW